MAELSESDLAPGELSESDLAEGEAGHAGHDPYAGGAYANQPKDAPLRTGDWKDALKNAADVATLGLAPKLEGLGAAYAQDASNLLHGEPFHPKVTPMQAYEDVKNEGEKEHASSANTLLGKSVVPIASLMTPLPIKGSGAGIGPAKWPLAVRKGLEGAAVAGGVGAVEGANSSKGDSWQTLADALKGAGLSAPAGFVGGATLSVAQPKLEGLAETQALRAAGLRGGIKEQLGSELGISNMNEARELGRQFLDEGLIPRVGSAEAVQKKAEALQGIAGNAKGALRTQAQSSGKPFDFSKFESVVRDPIMDPTATTTNARNRAGAKALQYADDIAEQGQLTPGSWDMADKMKSDAWRTADFRNDPKLAPQMYRQAVGRSAGEIERQIGDALGPSAQADFAGANKKYGIAADAIKLAENASKRDAAKKGGLGLAEKLALLGAVGGGSGAVAGHSIEGALAAIASGVAGKAFDKYGHSSASRFADFMANQAGSNTGGIALPSTTNALAPWSRFLKPDEGDE